MNYFQRKRGPEIDFILNREIAYEVKATPHLSDVKKLERVSNELNLKGFQVVSKNYSVHENVVYGFMV
ncbi:MAG: hypothetical protein ISS41_09945 [Candidatus Aminicenantes bacterium]|nr:hypothetical protein [Candidatus Aminicenantes bacterium]